MTARGLVGAKLELTVNTIVPPLSVTDEGVAETETTGVLSSWIRTVALAGEPTVYVVVLAGSRLMASDTVSLTPFASRLAVMGSVAVVVPALRVVVMVVPDG